MKVQFSFLPGKNSSILELKGKGGNKLLSSRISTNFLQQVSQIASLYQTLKKKLSFVKSKQFLQQNIS